MNAKYKVAFFPTPREGNIHPRQRGRVGADVITPDLPSTGDQRILYFFKLKVNKKMVINLCSKNNDRKIYNFFVLTMKRNKGSK